MKQILLTLFLIFGSGIQAFSQEPNRQATQGQGVIRDNVRFLNRSGSYRLQLPSENRVIPKEGNYVYNRWCDMDDVNATYISPEMFRLIKKLPPVELFGRDLDFSPIIQYLSGMYMLEFSQFAQVEEGTYVEQPGGGAVRIKQTGPVEYKRNDSKGGLRKDIRDYLDEKQYKTLMEQHRNAHYTRIYAASDGNMVTGFVLVDLDEDFCYGRFICFEGKIPQARFDEILTKAVR